MTRKLLIDGASLYTINEILGVQRFDYETMIKRCMVHYGEGFAGIDFLLGYDDDNEGLKRFISHLTGLGIAIIKRPPVKTQNYDIDIAYRLGKGGKNKYYVLTHSDELYGILIDSGAVVVGYSDFFRPRLLKAIYRDKKLELVDLSQE